MTELCSEANGCLEMRYGAAFLLLWPWDVDVHVQWWKCGIPFVISLYKLV